MNFHHKYIAKCNFSYSKGLKGKCQTLYGHFGNQYIFGEKYFWIIIIIIQSNQKIVEDDLLERLLFGISSSEVDAFLLKMMIILSFIHGINQQCKHFQNSNDWENFDLIYIGSLESIYIMIKIHIYAKKNTK